MAIINTVSNFFHKRKSQVISDKLFNNIFWNSIGRFSSAGLGFLITIFLMSALDVVGYGEYVFFFSIYSTIPYLTDLGLNNSFISIGAGLEHRSQNYRELVSNYFTIKSSMLLVLLAASMLGAVTGLLDRPVVVLVLFGVVLGFWESFLTVFKSQQSFRLLSCLVPSRNLLALLFILICCVILPDRTSFDYLLAVMISPLVLCIPVYVVHFRSVKLSINKALLKAMLSTSKWVALFSLVTAIHAKTDIYLLRFFASDGTISSAEVGIFSAAFSLLSVGNLITSTLAEATLPKISQESNVDYFVKFIRRIKRTIPFVTTFALVLGIILYFVFSFAFNGKYRESIDCMIFIAAGMILTFYIHTLSTVFYPLQRTRIIFKAIVVMFFLNVTLGFALIPYLGAVGAAITHMLVAAAGLAITAYWINKLILENEGSEP